MPRVTTLSDTESARCHIEGALCLLPDGSGHRAERCDVLVVHGCIAELNPAGHGAAPSPGDRVIDATDCLLVPGFVNAHSHSPDNLIAGTAPALPLEQWSLACAAARGAPSAREIYVSALLGCIEMLRSGTTTVLDHVRFADHLDADGLDAVANAYRDAGMRAVIAPVVADRPLADTLPLDAEDMAGLPSCQASSAPQMPADEQVARVADFVRRWHGTEGRILGAIGPSGPQRCTDALLMRCGAFSQAHGLLLHTHVLETRAQREMGRRLHGGSTIRHLDERGLLGRRTHLVHSVWVDDEDLDRIARKGAAVVHNPVSNARLGSGVAPVPAMLRRGIRVALGTDSACCNDSNHMLETAKWAALLHNTRSHDSSDWIGPQTALRLATRDGADALGLGTVTGAISVGLAADLSLFKLQAPGLVPLHDPVQQLVLSHARAAADLVMVAGCIVVRDGACTRIREAALWAEAQAFADQRRSVARTAPAIPAHPLFAPLAHMHRRIHALPSLTP